MTEEDHVRVRVRPTRLDDGAPVALRDTAKVYDLAIDFDAPPDEVAAALQEILQEGIDSGRWVRIPKQRTTDASSPPATASP